MYPNLPPPSERPQASYPQIQSASDPSAKAVLSVYPDTPAEPNPQEPDDSEILREAQEFFRAVADYESEWRRKALEEYKFVNELEHWSQDMKQERGNRPCLVFDRIGPAIDQVVNDARQSVPEPRVSPVGQDADKETAEVLQGMVRNIENDSNAKVVWASAYEPACKIGRGWVRIVTEYEDDESDLQKIKLKRVFNPFMVYADYACSEFDGSDMRRLVATEDLDMALYKETYPDSEAAGAINFQTLGDILRREWFPEKSVRVAEFWKVLIDRYQVSTLEDGRRLRKEEVQPQDRVRSTRWVEKRKVKWWKLNGIEILDRGDWLGKWIPFIPVVGKEIMVAGRRSQRGMVRSAMDANLSYDYMRSKQSEAIGLAPISQWMVAEQQLEGHKQDWAQSNRVPAAVLEYHAVSLDGVPIPPPQRISPSVDLSAIVSATAAAAEDIRATTASYRPDVGEPQPDQSGRAILAIQKQGDNAHFGYHDNLAIAQQFTLRQILDLIPKIYDEKRAVTIFDPDGSVRAVQLNQKFFEQGVEKIYDIQGPARYDVTLGSGPSYASRRDQGKDQLMQLVQAVPGPMSSALDLILPFLDVPGIDKIAERLRPPNVQQEQDGQAPIPPQVQAQMQQMQQTVQALVTQLNAQAEDLKTQRLRNESAERIAAGHDAATIAAAELKAGNERWMTTLDQQLTALSRSIEGIEQRDRENLDRQHEAAMQQADQQHQAQMQAQQQQAEAQQAQAAQAQQQPPEGQEPLPQAA